MTSCPKCQSAVPHAKALLSTQFNCEKCRTLLGPSRAALRIHIVIAFVLLGVFHQLATRIFMPLVESERVARRLGYIPAIVLMLLYVWLAVTCWIPLVDRNDELQKR